MRRPKSHCSRCKKLFDTSAKGTMIEIKAWVEVRPQGGANAVRDRRETGHVLCPQCGKQRKLGVIPEQAVLFQEGVAT